MPTTPAGSVSAPPDANGLLGRRLLFVTGKGGVGRTSVAGALALLASGGGGRVLCCEMEASGELARAFDCPPLAYAPRRVAEGLHLMAMETDAALAEYLHLHLHLPLVPQRGALADALDFVANAAPGVREILTVGKLCYEVREDHYDLVVVDATASGHIIGHLEAPVALHELAPFGALAEQSAWIREMLADPLRCAAVIVTTAEETPVTESLELAQRLAAGGSIALGAVIANHIPPPLGTGREALLAGLAKAGARKVLARRLGLSPSALVGLLEAGALAHSLAELAGAQLERLIVGLEGLAPLYQLPALFPLSGGSRVVHRLAAALAEELP